MPGIATPFTRLRLGAQPFILPPAFALDFDPSMFDDGDFLRHGIARPPSIAGSVARRQAEYLAGRRTALAAICAAGGAARDIPIGPNRAPAWPEGFIGSITHTQSIAVAIALPATMGVNGVGIDAEHVALAEHVEAIRRMAINKQEYDRLADLADARGWPYALTLAFSAKESFYKATAATVGHFFDFSALRIDTCDPVNGRLEASIVDTLSLSLAAGQRHTLHWIEIGPETLLTSCIW